jgi:hypothetical protein
VQPCQVSWGELVQYPPALGCEPHPDQPRVPPVGGPADQTCRFRPVHELDGAVMTQEQVAGQLANGRRIAARMPPDRHEQLVLYVGQSGPNGLVLAPALEPAQAGAEGEQVLEIPARRLAPAVLIHFAPFQTASVVIEIHRLTIGYTDP